MKRPFYGHPAQMPWRATPSSGVVFVLAALVAVATELGQNSASLYLYIIEPRTGDQEVWRWWSPVLLHFSWTHLIFNGLWLFIVGRLIEWRSPLTWWTLLVVAGIAGNALQWAIGSWRFGGLSGVVYGMLGYVWVWDRLRVDRYDVPPVYLGLSLFFLLLGFSGMDRLIGVNMANGAHLGGLLAGLGIGAMQAIMAKKG